MENDYVSIIMVVFDHDSVVGASTGMALKDVTVEIKQPWLEYGEYISRIFYLSESVIMEEYRGLGLGVKFFEDRVRWARQQVYVMSTFCGVIRQKEEVNHDNKKV